MAQACFGKTLSLPIEAQGLRVLLVEHDVNYMNHMTKVLEQHSWRVTAMEKCSDALCLVYSKDQFEYDLIIYEINMPGMDGFNFMQRTKSKQVPVILTSWRGDKSLATKAMKQGASFFLQKPIVDQYLANVAQYVLKPEGTKLNCEYQSSTTPMATPHSTTSTSIEIEDRATQLVPDQFKGKRDGNTPTDLQSVGFSGIEWVKSTNQLRKGFFPKIIHGMCLYSKGPVLEQSAGKLQENSCWNMLRIPKSPCMQELEISPAMRNNSLSLLSNYNMEGQVNTEKSIEFNYENNNEDTSLFENKEVPTEPGQMIGQSEMDYETQQLLSDYGCLNYGGNCQSGLMNPVEASTPQTVEQGEGNLGIFGGENETFENFIDYQFEDQMEMFCKSFEDDASNKGIIQMLEEDIMIP